MGHGSFSAGPTSKNLERMIRQTTMRFNGTGDIAGTVPGINYRLHREYRHGKSAPMHTYNSRLPGMHFCSFAMFFSLCEATSLCDLLGVLDVQTLCTRYFSSVASCKGLDLNIFRLSILNHISDDDIKE